jgi:hypothetical protein
MKMSHIALGGLFLLLGAGIYLTMKTEMDGRLEDMRAENEQKYEKYERAQREQAALIAKNADALKEAQKAAAQPVATLPKVDPRKTAAAITAAAAEDLNPAPAEVIKPSTAKKPAAKLPQEVADAPPEDLVPPVPDAADSPIDPVEAAMREKERNILNDPGVGSERMTIETGKISGKLPSGVKLTNMQSRVVALPAIARVKEVKESDGFVVLDRGQNSNLAKGDKFSVRRGTFILGPVTISDTINATECVADVGRLIDGASIQKGDEIIKWDR